MKQYQRRALTEKKELDRKIDRSKDFLVHPPKISERDIRLLREQLGYMHSYSRVLGERIRGFESC